MKFSGCYKNLNNNNGCFKYFPIWAVFMTRTPLKHNVNKGPYLVLISTLEDPLFPRINRPHLAMLLDL